jgi:phosphocarrier protein
MMNFKHRNTAQQQINAPTHSRTQASSQKAAGTLIVTNDKGLHTRPSTEIVKCATTFKAQIHLRYQDSCANAKSLLSILMLAAARGARIDVEATGEDASAAVETILNLARNKFNIKY